ncbi:UDP-N-acetylmuramoyl-L-alanine--D-glutamate ligase [Candidatus Gracilibacteria bacterium]|nr:UDP-N-acetylmuramoyl-L-alanine--D-glutamate ligase [Candidatus Gracilibacteria bacterium]NUJ99376.1 UDP-N-acetylmuramoyl-L-alanine--D-glutamate ligase [Candidatus Gracilibacteria bacterium]
MKIKEIKVSDIAVFGFGREGKSTLLFLFKLGKKRVSLFDEKEEVLFDFIKFLVDLENTLDFEVKKGEFGYEGKVKLLYKQKKVTIKFYFGDIDYRLFTDFDAIIKTPGISPYNDKYANFREKFISQTTIFKDNYKGKVIGITGTKGKSTISTLIYECLKEAGFDTKLVGNIGKPVLDQINILEKTKYDYVVYEMSSYMLEDHSPKNYISILNNIYECHIDRHGSFEAYKKAKANILSSAKYSLINYDFRDMEPVKRQDKSIVFHFGRAGDYRYEDGEFLKGKNRILKDKNILLKGEHNKRNITAVLGVLDIILKDKKKVKKVLSSVLQTFSGLPHRIQNIGTYKGITFIDDAIAVAPESTIEAMKTFSSEIGTLFLGGQDRGDSEKHFEELEKKIIELDIQNLVLFPDTGYKIFEKYTKNLEEEKSHTIEIGDYKAKIIKTRTMKKGVSFAYKHTKEGKIALLSCASPSFSLWKNYEEKGNLFQQEVQEQGKE